MSAVHVSNVGSPGFWAFSQNPISPGTAINVMCQSTESGKATMKDAFNEAFQLAYLQMGGGGGGGTGQFFIVGVHFTAIAGPLGQQFHCAILFTPSVEQANSPFHGSI